jgi:hypothetical protein
MSPSSLTGLILALMTLVVAALPFAMSLNLEFDGVAPPAADQAAPPAGPDRTTIERAFDAEALRQGLERGENRR